jgi:hypothetical protein
MKAMLQILLEEISIPFFVLWKWTEDDYKKGLSVKIGDWTAVFYFVPAKFSTGLPDRQFSDVCQHLVFNSESERRIS